MAVEDFIMVDMAPDFIMEVDMGTDQYKISIHPMEQQHHFMTIHMIQTIIIILFIHVGVHNLKRQQCVQEEETDINAYKWYNINNVNYLLVFSFFLFHTGNDKMS